MRNRIGRPRFMQSFASAGGGPFLATPPSDGETYGVKNGDTWIEVCEEAPKNGTLYGRISNAWQPIPSGGDPGTASGVLFTPAGNISATNVQAAIQELDNEKVAKAGDTMTGFLTLHANPDAPLKAATKQYVDTALGNAGVTISDTAPTPNQGKMWWESDTGVLWMSYTDASSTQWIGVGGTTAAISDASKADLTYVNSQDALRVLKAGDTMTGDLTISKAVPLLVLNETSASVADVRFNRNGGRRWIWRMDGSAEAGANGGSNFGLYSYGDDGTANIGSPIYVVRSNAAVWFASTVASTSPTTGALLVAGGVGVGGAVNTAGDLTITKVSANVSVNKTTDASCGITGQRNGLSRWRIALAGGAAESGSNLGSDFAIQRFDDAGVAVGTLPLIINRNSGGVVFGLGSSIALQDGTPSTATSTGALVIAGGVGIAGASHIGGAIYGDGGVITLPNVTGISASYAMYHDAGSMLVFAGGPNGYQWNNSVNTAGLMKLTDGGTFQVTNGSGGYQCILENTSTGTHKYGLGVANPDGRFTIDDITNAAARLAISPGGIVSIASVTPSTSVTTGALVVAGGMGVNGAIYHNYSFVNGGMAGGFSMVRSHIAFDSSVEQGLGILNVNAAASSNGAFVSFANSTHAVCGHIKASGANAVVYNTASDIRGKPNREPLSLNTARNIIDALEVYDFDKDGNAIRGIGLVAQQAHSVHKSLATPGHKNEDWWMAEKAAPMPFVIANVQQLNKRLDALEQMFESNKAGSQ